MAHTRGFVGVRADSYLPLNVAGTKEMEQYLCVKA